jgi:hypothetical protein
VSIDEESLWHNVSRPVGFQLFDILLPVQGAQHVKAYFSVPADWMFRRQHVMGSEGSICGQMEARLVQKQTHRPNEVKSLGANKYALDFGGGQLETVVADGTDQPGANGTTESITVEGPHTWKLVIKKNGRTLETGIWELSKDGRTLSDTLTANRSDGSTLHLEYVYNRTTAGSGFAGTWVSTSEKANSVLELQIRPYGGNGLSFINSEHVTLNMNFDEKSYSMVGPNMPPGAVSSGRRVNERTLEVTDKIKGKTRDTRQIKLSSDFKILTMTIRPAGRTTPNILVFDRE